MKRLSIVLISVLLVTLTGCTNPEQPVTAIKIRKSDNREIPYSHLLTIDNCKVYRFEDGGRLRYIAICPHSVTIDPSDVEKCGKNCLRPVDNTIHTSY